MSTLEGSALSCAEVLSRIEDIRPVLTEAIPWIEAARCLPSEVVDALRGTGVFAMVMPRARGGPELDPIEQFHVVEALARIDASIGWCVMIGSDSGYYSAFLDPDVAVELWPSLDLVTAGWVAPGGQGEVTDGGYRLSGRWSFGSGCQHADVFVGGFLVSDAGVPRFGPDGRPELRVAVFDPSAVEIHDTWHTTGLAGSGSTDYSVTDLMVPFEHTFTLLGGAVGTRRSEPLYAYPAMFLSNLAAVPLGVARASLDEFRRLAEEKMVMPAMHPLRDEARAQTAMGRAEALWASGRAWALDVLGELWDVLIAGGQPSAELRARFRLSAANACTNAREATELLYRAAGSTAIYSTSPLDRHYRDQATMAAHIVSAERNFEIAGRVLLGIETNEPLY